MAARALIIEDDPDLVIVISQLIWDLGYEVESASDGKTGLERALSEDFEFVILDLMLPALEGVEVCKRLRAVKSDIPIVALTSISDETSKVLLLELGADDYVTKPFSNRELKARIKSILRRTKSSVNESSSLKNNFAYKDLTIDFEARRVELHGEEVNLTAAEYDLLTFLALRLGHPISREKINESCFGYAASGYDDSLNSRINRIRAKIEKDRREPEYIITVRGVGYRFGTS